MMTAGNDIRGYYFVGIGGIGMSALARYFIASGFIVAGYDRTKSSITNSLHESGCDITYSDAVNSLPALFHDPSFNRNVIIVYTPAIPADSGLLSFFRNNGYSVYKRSEILGKISEKTDTIAVAGTHGKTTISTITAHLLKQSHLDCSAFLGGISRNYGSNLIIGHSRFTVMEADEFDRSFHRLSPLIAIISSLDADHLDIYGDRRTMIKAYNDFCSKTRAGGYLIVNKHIRNKIIVPANVTCYTYGLDNTGDYYSFNIEPSEGFYRFDIKTPEGIIRSLRFSYPGKINVENATAAIAVALISGVSEEELRNGLVSFKGVQRRFDIRLNYPDLVYIDDYAHHPEEIRACIRSVKDYFKGRKITGIFQPHLYSRTRDHAEGFASALDELDEIILLPVYPAREKPIEGISSGIILEKMKSMEKRLMTKETVINELKTDQLDILLTIGAGDIDTLVPLIEEKLKRERRK
jgi:UDP-N-acetylmuramate--alanine ligase